MAGVASEYFTEKLAQYQKVVEQASIANNKVTAAKQALTLLEKPTLTPADVDTLFALHDQAN